MIVQPDVPAKLFYGDIVVTFTLLEAAHIHRKIGPTLRALDLIVLRIAKGELEVEGENHPLNKTPVEVIEAIRDQVYWAGRKKWSYSWTELDNKHSSYVKSSFMRSQMWDNTQKNVGFGVSPTFPLLYRRREKC